MSEDKITYSQLHIGRDISYDRLKAKCGNLKNFDLIFKFFDDITPAKSGKIGYNEMDQVLNVMNDKGLGKKSSISKMARGLSSVPGFLSTVLISPILLGWFIPRLTYSNTRKKHATMNISAENNNIK